ncbi:MFS transporter [Amphiplicatus metriothermophilus]|uniref:Predicted arabinose efflux permease, MFS family n=1 Tax=Amphiplicatus metriothermophilus TaxID=1519374 RepID=A0A239Q0T9_9PROT|nr:MFS transporter [Amphiplicatus metriothermophilus]MBB5520044.1 MFS family permease [Amphiplicatus metriothermophilus]SNT75812.1 Predicted arabinose efflux permease, MFS family [Amphiplicatus metriothermophilus]
MLQAVAAISALLLAAAILLAGNGLQSTLISVRANIESFPTALIGVLMSAYFAGFVAGCRINPTFIKSVGHIRTFVALASIGSASALAHALIIDVTVWAILRAITGFCFAGLFMVIESWINERATNANRGRILSVYRIIDLVALTVGNAMLTIADPASFELFAIVSILVSIALVPVALTRSPAPKPIETARLDIPKLFAVSPAAAAAAPLAALANAAFWAMGPVYVQRLGHDAATIAAFMSAAIIGAAALQWPLGWLSDRIDRRKVMAGASLMGALSAFALAQFGAASQTLLIALGALVGAFIIPMFGLAAAHANDHAAPEEAVATNGGLLLLHGLGSVVGAAAGGVIISLAGPSSLFDYVGVVYTATAAVCIYRITRRAPLPEEEKTPFVPVPKNAAPTVFEIAQEEGAETAKTPTPS